MNDGPQEGNKRKLTGRDEGRAKRTDSARHLLIHTPAKSYGRQDKSAGGPSAGIWPPQRLALIELPASGAESTRYWPSRTVPC